jgi:nondiscriminating glutamyl-tRNA synthetase
MLESVFLNNKISKREFYSLIRKILTGKDRGPELLHIIHLLNKKEVKERLERKFS